MEIREEYIRRYWYRMVEDQIYDDYVAKGYEVKREYPLGDTNFRSDLFATRDDEKVLIEIVTKSKPREYIMRLYDIAHEMGADLKVIYANYVPITMKNGFEGFELEFEKYLNDINPGEFGEFGTHSRVDDIIDAEFAGVYVDGKKAEISGNCTVQLMAWFDNDDPVYDYYVPCKFTVEMEQDKDGWFVENHKVLEFDTSQLDR